MEHSFDWIRESQRLGFLGPSAPDVHLEQAFFFCDVIKNILPSFKDVLSPLLFDLGTGGGFPGLVIAEMLNSINVVLVESMAKRAAFLDKCVRSESLGERCKVLNGRAEVYGRMREFRESAQFVTAKAFARAAITAECASGLVAVGGFIVVSDPPGGLQSMSTRWKDVALEGLALERVESVKSPFAMTIFKKIKHLEEKYPRETQKMLKHPLF